MQTAPGSNAPIKDPETDPPHPTEAKPLARPALSPRLAGMLIGGLFFALYLVLLTRASLDAAMGNPPILGGWKSLAAVLVLGIAVVAVTGARSAGWTGRRLLTWIATHAEILSVSGLTLAALAIASLRHQRQPALHQLPRRARRCRPRPGYPANGRL